MIDRIDKRNTYIGNLTLPDPTASIAISNIRMSAKDKYYSEKHKDSLKTQLTIISCQLAELNRRRQEGMPKKQFLQERAPLVKAFKALNRTHITRQEGGINNEKPRSA